MKLEIAAIQREREAQFPYGPDLKRRIIRFAIQELADAGPLHEISSMLGLDGQRLIRWFREVEEEMSIQEEK